MRPKSLSHPMKLGDFVAVFGRCASGQPFFEGSALIRWHCGQPHHYLVQFKGDPVLRSRFVNPDWQRAPQRSLEFLLAFWRTSQTPSFDEFFPDNRVSKEGNQP
jgi:hypothetical protein